MNGAFSPGDREENAHVHGGQSPPRGEVIRRIAGFRPGARPRPSGIETRYNARVAASNAGKEVNAMKDIAGLDNNTQRVYRALVEQLADGDKWIDYKALAKRLGIHRNTFAYHVKKLEEAKYIGTRNGKHYLMSG